MVQVLAEVAIRATATPLKGAILTRIVLVRRAAISPSPSHVMVYTAQTLVIVHIRLLVRVVSRGALTIQVQIVEEKCEKLLFRLLIEMQGNFLYIDTSKSKFCVKI